MSFEIRKYSSADASLWDAFVKSAWNGVFLFERGFMDYHADRFEDFSLLAFSGDKLKAVLPANRRDEVLHSHQGLTYGGWCWPLVLGRPNWMHFLPKWKAGWPSRIFPESVTSKSPLCSTATLVQPMPGFCGSAITNFGGATCPSASIGRIRLVLRAISATGSIRVPATTCGCRSMAMRRPFWHWSTTTFKTNTMLLPCTVSPKFSFCSNASRSRSRPLGCIGERSSWGAHGPLSTTILCIQIGRASCRER